MIVRKIALMMILILGIFSNGFCNEVAKVILLETMTLPLVQEHSEWFMEQMSAMGYEEGKTINLLKFNGEGSKEKLNSFLDDALKTSRPDLVITNATLASKVAKKRLSGTGIPILFFGVSDPVGSGLIEAIGKPTGNNITGKVHSVPRDTIIELIDQIVSGNSLSRPIRFGYIHADYPSSNGDIEKLKAAAKKQKDMIFVTYKLPYLKGEPGKIVMLGEALAGIVKMENKIDFWWQPRGPLGINPDFTKSVIDHSSIPLLYGATLNSVKMGALINISTNPESQGRETALLADTILNGTNAGSIPPTRPSQLQVAVNLTTATKLKLTIPSEILKMAKGNLFH